MAKKKKAIELFSKEISFTQNEYKYKLLYFLPATMTVDVIVFDGDKKEGKKNIPFAHLPREIKKRIKPN
jgi:hypothetical protein